MPGLQTPFYPLIRLLPALLQPGASFARISPL
jgi:hypothetical protein